MSSMPSRTASPLVDVAPQVPPSRPFQAVLRFLLGRSIPCGQMTFVAPGGARATVVGKAPGPEAELRIHDWRFVQRVLTSWEIGFAEGYMAGDWSSPDLAAVLELGSRSALEVSPNPALRMPRPLRKLRHALKRNTRRGSRRNIQAHYDLGNAFYAPWLDRGMSYSSALYASSEESLELAQTRKLDQAIDLLDLRGGERVLEIGCGWGSLAERLMERSDATLEGITLSDEQLRYAAERLARQPRATFRLQDYRDTMGTFDRIVSIEMLEAVGEAYWPAYFGKLSDLLVPGGSAVLQVITIEESRFDHYRRTPDFIQRYIFPGGMLPTPTIIRSEGEAAGLTLDHEERFGASYVRTLEEWQARFQRAWSHLAELGFDMRFKRMWEYYLDYCRAGFATGAVDVGFYRLRKA
jgi:cyclopropane-fatty-acyl-phospholipid synthase